MAGNLDIHDFNRFYQQTIELLKKGAVTKRTSVPISDRNAELILKYDEVRQLEGITTPTRARIIHGLINLARMLKKDFDKATKEDFKNLFLQMERSGHYAAWTRIKFAHILKRFYRWLKYGDNYLDKEELPDEVRWLKRNIRRKDLPKISPSDVLTEEDIKKLIETAEHPRDKALISLLSESGARIGEIGNLKIMDVYQDEHSYLIHLRGKTGERTDRVFYSDPFIASWLNIHPLRNNPDAPLWVDYHRHTQLKYGALLKLVKCLFEKAGINKRSNPHIFRHSRVTINFAKGWTEAEAKAYFGWTRDSKMLSIYSHITEGVANDAILRMHGIKPKIDTSIVLESRFCLICSHRERPDRQLLRQMRPRGC